MTKSKEQSLGLSLAVLIYYFLPRLQIQTLSTQWNFFFGLRPVLVLLITASLLFIIFQRKYGQKFLKLNPKFLIVTAYILYLLGSIAFMLVLEFI